MKLDVFLVLLFSTLVLSSVGVSSSDIVETLLQKFDEGAELQKETVINIKEHSKKIDAFILNVEKQLVDIAKDIGIINTEKSEHLHRAIKRYESIKIILKDVRVALHRLASQTLYKVDDIVIYLDAWDSDIYSLEEKKIYLEEQIDLMNELLIDSDAILKKAKSKYDEAYEEFIDIEGNLIDFKRTVEIHLEEAEEKAWTPDAMTIICGFITFGICTLADYLVTKEQLERELNHLRYTVEVAVEEVEEVMRNNAGLLSFIEGQTKKLVTWQESVKHVKKFLDKKDISEKIVNLR
jgi:cell division protein FtsB